MIRKLSLALLAAVLTTAFTAGEVSARRRPAAPKSEPAAKSVPAPGGGKALELGKFNDWGAYSTQGAKGKICYALAQPRSREPSGLKRDPGYLFISSRPGEGVQGEVSFILGFPLKEGAADATASAGAESFELITKGENAWVANAAREPQFVDAMRKTGKLIVKAPSKKGNATTDTYSLAGLSQALERVRKECP